MNNFEIIKLNNEEDNTLIVMKTSEPPFDFLSEMEEALRNIQYLGYVTIDELLHSGNTEERFIQGFFNGNSFENGKFKFTVIEKKSKLREYACEFLRKDIELLHFTGLTGRQQRLIECGCVI